MASGVLPSACVTCGSERGEKDASGWRCEVCGWRVGDVPDADLPPVRIDVVYYLRYSDRIKIGTSSTPRSRLAQLRFHELLAFERGDRTVEHQRHVQFAEYRFPGSEWFHANRALNRHIRTLARGVTDPWEQYARWMSEQLALRVSRG